MMRIARTVAGILLIDDDDELVASDRFSEEMLPDALFDAHPLEEEYPDAERTVLDTAMIAAHTDLSETEIVRRQVAAARQYTRAAIQDAADRDGLLVQAVRALDDTNEVNNELSERLRPWYALYFPELEEAIDDNERFAELVATSPEREAAAAEAGMDIEESTGMPLDDRDREMVRSFAARLVEGYEMRDELEDYVADLAREVVPNLTAVLEPLLAARLIAEAGSLEKLAKMPSSTVQVLGAEKAMFRHMKGEGSAPKHGVLFMHPLVRGAPRDSRGKMARVIANKASIAARIDQYEGEFRGDALRQEIEDTFEDVTG